MVAEKIAWDNEIVEEFKASFSPETTTCSKRPADGFRRNRLPVGLARKRIQVIVLTGIHLDWCIEGNARAAGTRGISQS